MALRAPRAGTPRRVSPLRPAGFAAAAINVAVLPRETWRARIIKATPFWARTSVVTGIGFIVIVFFYYVATPFNFISRIDPVGSEANFDQLAARVQTQLDKTGATWIATTSTATAIEGAPRRASRSSPDV